MTHYPETPRFRFSRNGKTLFVSFNNHPLKDKDGDAQEIHFRRECESDLEAKLLGKFMEDMLHATYKEKFTEGFEAHKKRQKNYYL